MNTSGTPSSGHDDPVPRDAWLGEALRHAPDADAAPPAAVREEILRRARMASAPRGAGAGAREALQRWWEGLARPMVAGGLGTAAVSVLVAVLWWHGAPPPEAPAASGRDAVEARSELSAPATEQALKTPPPRAADQPAAREEPRQAAPARQGVEPARRKAAPPLRRAAPVDDAAPARGMASTPVASPPAAASPTTAPAVTAAAPAAVIAEAASIPGAAAPATASMQRSRSAEVASAGPADSNASAARAPSAAAPMAAPMANSFARVDPLAAEAAALDAAGGEWHWMRGTEAFAHGEAQRAWFQALQRATAGRWQRGAASDASDTGTPLQLFDGARLRLTFVLGPHAVVLRGPGPITWRAPLSSTDRAALEALLRSW